MEYPRGGQPAQLLQSFPQTKMKQETGDVQKTHISETGNCVWIQPKKGEKSPGEVGSRSKEFPETASLDDSGKLVGLQPHFYFKTI